MLVNFFISLVDDRLLN